MISVADRTAAHPNSAIADDFVAHHGTQVLRVARRYSVSAADAEDAYQRSLELLLTKAPTDDRAGLLPWMLSVVRNEALMIHRRRKRLLGDPVEDVAAALPDPSETPDETLEEAESFRQRHEALMRIPADQMRCLLLKADGHDYEHISRITGFTRSKINWCLTNGRRAMRSQLRNVESGTECRRLEPILGEFAEGIAAPQVERDVRLHLSNCLACRVTMRELRAAPQELAALLPVGAAIGHNAERLAGHAPSQIEALIASVNDRLAGSGGLWRVGSEAAAAKKVLAVTAIAATLATGGAGVSALRSNQPATLGMNPSVRAAVPLESPDAPASSRGQADQPAGDGAYSPAAPAFVIDPGTGAEVGGRIRAGGGGVTGDSEIVDRQGQDEPAVETERADVLEPTPAAPGAGAPADTTAPEPLPLPAP